MSGIGLQRAFDHGQLLLAAEEGADVDVRLRINAVADGQESVFVSLRECVSCSGGAAEFEGCLSLKWMFQFLQSKPGLTGCSVKSLTGIRLLHANVCCRGKISLKDSPVNGTAAIVFELMSDS